MRHHASPPAAKLVSDSVFDGRMMIHRLFTHTSSRDMNQHRISNTVINHQKKKDGARGRQK
jgi:hypothetical protein